MRGLSMLKSMKFPEKLRQSREAAGLTQTQLGERLGVTQGAVQQWESGEIIPRPSRFEAIASAVNVDAAWLFQGIIGKGAGARKLVPVVGYVGAGAQIFPVDDHLKGSGFDEVEAPPTSDEDSIVAVKVRGDSMVPAYWDGDIIYYGDHESDPLAVIGKEVVVCTEEGSILIKRLARGRVPGHFDLISYAGMPMQDVRLQWIARVRWVKRA